MVHIVSHRRAVNGSIVVPEVSRATAPDTSINGISNDSGDALELGTRWVVGKVVWATTLVALAAVFLPKQTCMEATYFFFTRSRV